MGQLSFRVGHVLQQSPRMGAPKMTSVWVNRYYLAAGGTYYSLDTDMVLNIRPFTNYFVRTSTYDTLGCRLLWEKAT
jgi:hypothetical protein